LNIIDGQKINVIINDVKEKYVVKKAQFDVATNEHTFTLEKITATNTENKQSTTKTTDVLQQLEDAALSNINAEYT
jgi:hypothetical protein